MDVSAQNARLSDQGAHTESCHTHTLTYTEGTAIRGILEYLSHKNFGYRLEEPGIEPLTSQATVTPGNKNNLVKARKRLLFWLNKYIVSEITVNFFLY